MFPEHLRSDQQMELANIICAFIGYSRTSNATYEVTCHPFFSDPTFFESVGSFPKDESSHIKRSYPLIVNNKMKDSSLSPVL